MKNRFDELAWHWPNPSHADGSRGASAWASSPCRISPTVQVRR